MNELTNLYGGVIRDHARAPRFAPMPAQACCKAERRNPLCGDRVVLGLHTRAGMLDLGCEVRACAICVASASIMCSVLRGLALDPARALCDRFLRAAHARTEPWPGLPGELDAFAALRDFPARVGCACLPWEALRTALASHSSAA